MRPYLRGYTGHPESAHLQHAPQTPLIRPMQGQVQRAPYCEQTPQCQPGRGTSQWAHRGPRRTNRKAVVFFPRRADQWGSVRRSSNARTWEHKGFASALSGAGENGDQGTTRTGQETENTNSPDKPHFKLRWNVFLQTSTTVRCGTYLSEFDLPRSVPFAQANQRHRNCDTVEQFLICLEVQA